MLLEYEMSKIGTEIKLMEDASCKREINIASIIQLLLLYVLTFIIIVNNLRFYFEKAYLETHILI